MTDDSGAANRDPRDESDAAAQAEPDPGAPDTGAPDPSAPKPGVKSGAKRRRTASMKVARTETEAADGAQPDSKPTRGAKPSHGAPKPDDGRLPGPFDKAWVNRLRGFLDSTQGRILVGVSAAIALPLGPLAIYSVFALVFLFRRPLRRAVARLPLGPRTTLAVFIVLAGLVRETIAWTGEYIQGDEMVVLWHHQLIPDLLFGLGMFAAWAAGWALALRWFRYSLIEVLFIHAIYGLAIESFGLLLVIGLSTLPGGIVLLMYAVVLSAGTVGIAWVLAQDKLATLPGPGSDSAFRYAAPPVLISVAVVLILM
ncbi:MAG: hypothetical protein GEU94_19640, partial [Micromonosporaceae bacterium]|nr:hypothetical protein [Micromonosporaceae bacterium]